MTTLYKITGPDGQSIHGGSLQYDLPTQDDNGDWTPGFLQNGSEIWYNGRSAGCAVNTPDAPNHRPATEERRLCKSIPPHNLNLNGNAAIEPVSMSRSRFGVKSQCVQKASAITATRGRLRLKSTAAVFLLSAMSTAKHSSLTTSPRGALAVSTRSTTLCSRAQPAIDHADGKPSLLSRTCSRSFSQSTIDRQQGTRRIDRAGILGLLCDVNGEMYVYRKVI